MCTDVNHSTRVRRGVALATAVVALLAGGIGCVRAQSNSTITFQLTALASGNWNSAGVHTVSNYQIGHSNELPNNQAAYFEFNLNPIQGRTLVANVVLVVGSTDSNISSVYAPRCGTAPCFKVGITPQGTFTTDQIVSPTSNNNTEIYLSGNDPNRNQDLGYAWVENGLHPGLEFNADTYNVARLQSEITAGGNWVFWGRDDFDTGEGTVNPVPCAACPGGFENYIWGSTAYNTGISMIVTVDTGPATTAVIQSGTYQITNLNSGLALEVPAGQTADGTFVDQSTYTGGTNQQWIVTLLANGSYTITSVNPGQLLDVHGASKASGAAIDIWPANGHTNQEWTFAGTNDGNYTIKSVGSGLSMGVSGALTLNGAAIDQFNANGNANQQWSFQLVQ